jgi:hypothetical protein
MYKLYQTNRSSDYFVSNNHFTSNSNDYIIFNVSKSDNYYNVGISSSNDSKFHSNSIYVHLTETTENLSSIPSNINDESSINNKECYIYLNTLYKNQTESSYIKILRKKTIGDGIYEAYLVNSTYEY